MKLKYEYTASITVTVNASASKVWQALTDPTLIKQYFFGVDVITSWEPGSPIFYRGEWAGKVFEEKGTVIAVQENKRLKSSYWTPAFHLPDLPENYQIIVYELDEQNGKTALTVTQSNIPTADAAKHSEENWKIVLDGLKRLLES